MPRRKQALALRIEEARGLMLAAQGLLEAPPPAPALAEVRATIERLGAVQIDTISVVKRSQYLVLWSRLGAYDPRLLDALLHPHRAILEYWSHAASIVPISDYPYYRQDMLRAWRENMWTGTQSWMARNPEVIQRTLATIRERGPLASSDFERDPAGARTGPWDWYGPKDSRRALDVLWTTGDLMVHSRRGGQKVYDLRERVLAGAFGAGAFGEAIPRDDDLPTPEAQLRHFARRTVAALGVVTPSWLWDYFRLREYYRNAAHDGKRVPKRTVAQALLATLAAEGVVVPATVEGLAEPAYVARERLADLERLRGGATPERTTLLSPFDSLIWDRARARALFGYEVCFEAYVLPAKRRYGYYCLAILHRGRLVGRLDPKMDRAGRCLRVRALHLEPGMAADEALLDGLADALRELARFLGAERVAVEGNEEDEKAGAARALRERVAGAPVG